MTTIFTIGHSNHSFERFVQRLREHHFQTVVDVRLVPYSKWVPHFSKNALQAQLPALGFHYIYLGVPLGGKSSRHRVGYVDTRANDHNRVLAPDFKTAISDVINIATSSKTVLMCAEVNPEKCHRHRLLASALVQQSATVVHVLAQGGLLADVDVAAKPFQPNLFSADAF